MKHYDEQGDGAKQTAGHKGVIDKLVRCLLSALMIASSVVFWILSQQTEELWPRVMSALVSILTFNNCVDIFTER